MSPTPESGPSVGTKEGWSNATTGVSNALKKYESESVGLAYDDLPPELCEGTDLKLSKWSLVVTDNSLKMIADLTKLRVQRAINKKLERSFRPNDSQMSGLTLEEEMEQLKEMELNSVVSKPRNQSKRKTRLEMSLDSITGSKDGPSAEEQNIEEENYAKQEEAKKKVMWEEEMKKSGLLSLDISGSERITDRGIKAIADICITLKELSISGSYQVTDVGLRSVSLGCPHLRSLNLSGCMGVAGPGFAVVGQCCRNLNELKLSGCRQIPTWVMLNIFDGCRLLENLDLSYCNKLGDHEVKQMAEKCNVIKDLNLRECKQVSDVGVLAVSQGCSNLETIDLSRSELQFKITDVALLALGERSPVLKKLNLNGCEMITDAGLSWLAKGCRGLEWLDMTNCSKVTNGGMRCLGEGCPNLKYCQFVNMKKVTDVGIRFLAQGCNHLETLNATGIFLLSDGMKRDFGFEGLQALGRADCAKTIKNLNLTGCFQVSTSALKALALLTNCEQLTLSGCVNLTTQGMVPLSENMRNVKSANFAFCGECASDLMMSKVLKNWSRLKSINFTDCENIGAGTMKSLSKCKNIKRVDLSGCTGLDDLALIPFCEEAYWPGIGALYLTGCSNIGDTGLSWIADGLRNTVNEVTLVTLSLKGTRCSHSALKAVRDRYKFSELRRNDTFFGLWPLSRATERIVINDYGTLFRACTKIQSLYRARKDRQRTMVKKEAYCKAKAALKLQARWRGRKDRERVKMLRWEKNMRGEAAIRIQNMYKAWVGRKWLRAKRHAKWLIGANKAATDIQRRFRGMCGRAKFEIIRTQRLYILELQSRNSIVIQTCCRKCLARMEYWRRFHAKVALEKKMQADCWKIQCCWRQKSATMKVSKQARRLKKLAKKKRKNATKIQNRYRAYRCRSVLREGIKEKKLMHKAATYVQCVWRSRQAWLEVETKRQIWIAEQESKSAIKLQQAWRRRSAQKMVEAIKEERKRLAALRVEMASLVERWWRGILARREAAELKKQYLAQLRRMAELENWGATIIAGGWRGKKGRDLSRARLWERKARWKEMWSDEEQRKFYYNQISGEIRWRKPQDLLDLMRRPICSNCEFYEARMECGDCKEFFCVQCWNSVHFGGKRAKHVFRQLYDYYEKRVDYGDGEFPSRWPSEIEQDEFSGWRLRVYPARKPYKKFGDWEIYTDKEGSRFFYHNRMKHLSQYEKPDELRDIFDDDWAGLEEGFDEDDGVGDGLGGDSAIREDAMVADEKKNEDDVVESAPIPAEGAKVEEVMQEGWGKYFDDISGDFYYFNVETGESTYDRPDNFETLNNPFQEFHD